MGLTLVTPATVEALDLALTWSHLRVTDTVQAGLLQEYFQSACEWIEKLLDRQLLTATWQYTLDAFPRGDTIVMPRAPLQSVTSITYYNELGVPATFAPASYQVDIASEPGRVALVSGQSWPTTVLRTASGVVIQFVAGYGVSVASIPAPIRQALRLLVTQAWTQPEGLAFGVSVQELPYGIWDYLAPYRIGVGVA